MSVQDTYCTYGLIMADTDNGRTTNNLRETPKLPNVPTYGQLSPAFSCTTLLEQGQGQKKKPGVAVLIP